LFLILDITASGQEEKERVQREKEFEASNFILEHIADSHEWHLITKSNGESLAFYLPVIVYDKQKGLKFFSSRHLAHGKEYKGFKIAEEGNLAGTIVSVGEDGKIDEENIPLDFSVTKVVFSMFIAFTIGLLLFILLARSYKKTGISEPKGIQSFLEPIILFVQDDIALPNIGSHHYQRFMPYLLSVFFFILLNNLMGLIPIPPFGANVTGNIAITFVLAVFTFLITQLNGSRSHWKHIFAPPGVPFWLLPIMIPVEIIGVFSKPFALMIRLFANITAGHIIVLSLICLIFVFKALWVAFPAAFFVIFMDCLELLVAFLQAYVFTLLSSLFIGLAVQEEH
jgi:F-type H+-transporting ATPase subunit a